LHDKSYLFQPAPVEFIVLLSVSHRNFSCCTAPAASLAKATTPLRTLCSVLQTSVRASAQATSYAIQRYFPQKAAIHLPLFAPNEFAPAVSLAKPTTTFNSLYSRFANERTRIGAGGVWRNF